MDHITEYSNELINILKKYFIFIGNNVYPMEDLNKICPSSLDAIKKAMLGNRFEYWESFNPNDDYVAFTREGNLISITKNSLVKYIEKNINIDKFISWAKDNGYGKEAEEFKFLHSKNATVTDIDIIATTKLKACCDDYNSYIWEIIRDDVIDDVVQNIDDEEDEFSDGDVSLAIGRAIINKMK